MNQTQRMFNFQAKVYELLFKIDKVLECDKLLSRKTIA